MGRVVHGMLRRVCGVQGACSGCSRPRPAYSGLFWMYWRDPVTWLLLSLLELGHWKAGLKGHCMMMQLVYNLAESLLWQIIVRLKVDQCLRWFLLSMLRFFSDCRMIFFLFQISSPVLGERRTTKYLVQV